MFYVNYVTGYIKPHMVFYSLIRLSRSGLALTKPTLFKSHTRSRWTSKSMEETTGTKKALVFLAPGSEEVEFTVAVDVLRRAGVQVYVCGVQDKQTVKCSRDVNITPDIAISDADQHAPYDAIVLPGGMGGTNAMAASADVGRLLKQQEKNGGIIAAICAAPIVLKSYSIYAGKSLTSYPGVEDVIAEAKLYTYKTDDVVVDGPLITSRGPGTALQFAFTITDKLMGKAKASKIASDMLLKYE